MTQTWKCTVNSEKKKVASDVPTWHQVWFQQGTLKVAHLGSHQRIVTVIVIDSSENVKTFTVSDIDDVQVEGG